MYLVHSLLTLCYQVIDTHPTKHLKIPKQSKRLLQFLLLSVANDHRTQFKDATMVPFRKLRWETTFYNACFALHWLPTAHSERKQNKLQNKNNSFQCIFLMSLSKG